MAKYGPKRSTTPDELTDEQLFCHAFGHDWDDPPLLEAKSGADGKYHLRRDHTCERGCGCTKGYYVERKSGDQWGYKRNWSDGYGLDGGYRRAELRAAWFDRMDGGSSKPRSRKRKR